MTFYNRDIERNVLKNYVRYNQRLNIIFSGKGYGKTEMIKYVLNEECGLNYINVNPIELVFDEYAPDFFFIKEIAKSISNSIPKQYHDSKLLSIYERIPELQFGISFGIVELGKNIGIVKNLLKQSIITTLNIFSEKVYLHIENSEKIDKDSLKFLIQLINETTNVNIFLECTCNDDFCYDINEFFIKNLVKPYCYNLPKMEWSYVECILHDYNISLPYDSESEYNGNIKALIINNLHHYEIKLEDNEAFILCLIALLQVGTSEEELFYMLNNYLKFQRTIIFNISLKKLKRIIAKLSSFGLTSVINNRIRLTKRGEKHVNFKYEPIVIQIISNYYIPFLLQDNTVHYKESLDGIHILVPLYAKNNDDRIMHINNFIENKLSQVYLNEELLNSIYTSIYNVHDKYFNYLKLLLAKLYVRIGCYNKALNMLTEIENSEIKTILYYTILIHLLPDSKKCVKEELEEIIGNTNNKQLKSALYTCVLGFYMREKTSAEAKNYYEQKCTNNADIVDCDKYIIQKNASIYYSDKRAKQMILDACRFFRCNNMFTLAICSYLTLSTRNIQCGNISAGKRILFIIERSIKITEETQAYIDNNLSVIDIITNNTNSETKRRLKDTYYFCEDLYSKLLVTNNLLIFSIIDDDFVNAARYANEIERIGFDKYRIDEYLHVAYTNLLYYYSSTKNNEKFDCYKEKLTELLSYCDSEELKKFIRKQIYNKSLDKNDRWYFMSKLNCRPAFMGHWFINYFDY